MRLNRMCMADWLMDKLSLLEIQTDAISRCPLQSELHITECVQWHWDSHGRHRIWAWPLHPWYMPELSPYTEAPDDGDQPHRRCLHCTAELSNRGCTNCWLRLCEKGVHHLDSHKCQSEITAVTHTDLSHFVLEERKLVGAGRTGQSVNC